MERGIINRRAGNLGRSHAGPRGTDRSSLGGGAGLGKQENELVQEQQLRTGGRVCAMGGGRRQQEKGKETELAGADGLGWGPAGKTGQAIWRKAVDTASPWTRPMVEAGRPRSTGRV